MPLTIPQESQVPFWGEELYNIEVAASLEDLDNILAKSNKLCYGDKRKKGLRELASTWDGRLILPEGQELKLKYVSQE